MPDAGVFSLETPSHCECIPRSGTFPRRGGGSGRSFCPASFAPALARGVPSCGRVSPGAAKRAPDAARNRPFTGKPRDCNTQFTTQLGGNPDLDPERSTNFTAGDVWETVSGVTLGVDYWNPLIADPTGRFFYGSVRYVFK